MEYQVSLNNGNKFNVTDENFNVLAFTEKMNDPQIACISIGGSAIIKHSFISVIPLKLITDNEATK